MTLTEADRRRIVSRVRHNAWSAGFAAALMLCYGFVGSFSIPDKDGLYTLACNAFVYTLQGGGILMALSAALCLVGIWQALYFDAFVSALIGIALALSAAVQVVHGDIIAILYGVFGVMFLLAALRNYRDAGDIAALDSAAAPATWRDQPPPPPERSAGSDLRSKMKQMRDAHQLGPEPMHFESPAQEAEVTDAPSPAAPVDVSEQPAPATNAPAPEKPPTPQPKQAPPTKPPSGPPPPGGFLAALAKEDDDRE